MLVALTGTPGTGKSSVGRILEARGYAVVDLDELARGEGLITGRDPVRGAEEVDVEGLRQRIRVPAKLAFLKSHYSHLLDVDFTIVLRCRPSVLRERLRARSWTEAKVRENVEAEAIDAILQEAVARSPSVYEVDTTERRPAETADAILGILRGMTEGHAPGSVDWSDEVLSWF